jgi:HPt (histidine-containing phosphotransfer) domain-containing protein
MWLQLGLDFSDPDTKLEWHKEVEDSLGLIERCLIDGTASIKRIMSALEQYDSGKMTVELVFPSSVETRTIEKGLREPAHALKGAAATISMDRLALACRAIEHPLKAAAEEAEASGIGESERRAVIDKELGPKREIITAVCSRMQEVLDFMTDHLMEHLLEHRCGIADPELARAYIPTDEQLDAGAPMPADEPLDYNNEDWCDDIDDVAEDVDTFIESFPEGWLQSALAPYKIPS